MGRGGAAIIEENPVPVNELRASAGVESGAERW
jgi:hypothetical protein